MTPSVPTDEIAATGGFMSPAYVAVSGTGAVLAVVFGRVLHLYSWSGVAWVQRGNDIDSVAVGGLGYVADSVLALSEDGNIIASSAPRVSSDGGRDSPYALPSLRGAVAVFIWDGASWSPMGSTIVDSRVGSLLGNDMRLSALGSVMLVSESGSSAGRAGRALVYAWGTGTNDWMLRGVPLDGPPALRLYGSSVAMSSDGWWRPGPKASSPPVLAELFACMNECLVIHGMRRLGPHL